MLPRPSSRSHSQMEGWCAAIGAPAHGHRGTPATILPVPPPPTRRIRSGAKPPRPVPHKYLYRSSSPPPLRHTCTAWTSADAPSQALCAIGGRRARLGKGLRTLRRLWDGDAGGGSGPGTRVFLACPDVRSDQLSAHLVDHSFPLLLLPLARLDHLEHLVLRHRRNLHRDKGATLGMCACGPGRSPVASVKARARKVRVPGPGAPLGWGRPTCRPSPFSSA